MVATFDLGASNLTPLKSDHWLQNRNNMQLLWLEAPVYRQPSVPTPAADVWNGSEDGRRKRRWIGSPALFFSVQRLLIPPGWRLDRTEEIIPGRAVLAIMQDRYSTIGLISTYLHPCSKGTELRELITWLKQK